MRRKHRIIILVTLLVVVIAGGGGAVFFRQQFLDQRALANRERGMEAAQAGKHRDALHSLGSYLQRFGQKEDAEALYEYAYARLNIPLPNARHISQSIALLLQVLEIDPNYTKAQHELLDLYVRAQYGQETLDLAQKVLERDPGDVRALGAKARALAMLRDFDEALVHARQISELDPENTDNHFLVLALMENASAPDAEMLAYAGNQPGLQPGTTKYQLVEAVAHHLAGDNGRAREFASEAAQSVEAGSDDVPVTVNLLNRFGLYDDSLELLARTAPGSDNVQLLQLYCQRLFESGNIAELLAQTGDKPYAELDSTLLAIRGMALGREKNTAELETIAAELDARSDDTVADAWAPLLRAVWLGGAQSPQEVVRICSEAVEAEPGNPYFHYFQGLAYEQLGEREQAITAWQNAVRAAPAWIDPVLRGAGLLASIGRHGEAVSLVQEAMRRAPQNVSVAAASAEIIGSNIDALSEENQRNLLALADQVQQASPNEPRTLPLLVEMRARTGDTAAAKSTLQAALDAGQPLPEATLLKLAQISDTHDLGLAQACFDAIGAAVGQTPATVLAQALSALRSGDAEGGRRLLAEAAAESPDNPQWKLMTAQYLDAAGSPDTTAAWAAVVNEDMNNAAVLQRILDSRRAWDDTGLIDRVIEKLKTITGEGGVTWRVARARWLLLTDTSQKAAAEAASLLNDTLRTSLPEAQRYTLLATAMERLNNVQGAIDRLEQAVEIAPDSAAVRFELARLYGDSGRGNQASIHLDHVLNAATAQPADRRRAAALLARQGNVQRAIDVLLQLHPEEERAAPRDMLLAQLYRRAGQYENAEAICRRLLEDEPNVGVIEFTADLLASQGRRDEGREVLARLDALEETPAGVREMILAEFNRFYGDPAEAGRWYEAALEADNDNPIIWRRNLAYLVRAGKVGDALARLPEAAAACPAETAFATLNEQAGLLEGLRDNAIASPFILAAIEQPGSLDRALRALEVVRDSAATGQETLAIEFRRLAEQNPTFLTLKMQLVRLYAALNRHKDAASLADQSMRDFPNEIEPALLAAEAHAANEDWVNALGAAREWRRRAPGNPDAADLMIATAQIRLDRSTEAIDTISPYLARESGDPNQFSPMFASQARALINAGRAPEAAELLQPRLDKASPWRMLWIQLAVLDLPDNALAAEWLDQVAPLIPEDAIEERLALASAWYELAAKTSDPGHKQKAQGLIQALAQRPDVNGMTLFALGVTAERDGNPEAAEEHYRRALELDPTLNVAKNNLAMRYVTDNKNLDQALQLAQEITQADPNNANYHDTLGQVHAARGDLDAAIQALEKAAQLQPRNREWTDRAELFKQKKAEAALGSAG